MSTDDTMARIRKLLRVTVEAGCTPAEAKTAARHVTRLLAASGLTVEQVTVSVRMPKTPDFSWFPVRAAPFPDRET